MSNELAMCGGVRMLVRAAVPVLLAAYRTSLMHDKHFKSTLQCCVPCSRAQANCAGLSAGFILLQPSQHGSSA